MRALLAFLIAVTGGLQASAAEINATEKFHQLALTIPLEMMRVGATSFGNFDVATVMAQITQVQWRVNQNTNMIFAGSGGNRIFAINVQDEHMVLLDQQQLKQTADSCKGPLLNSGLQLIALHESLEAAGYDDENYQVTLAMYWFNWTPEIKGVHRAELDAYFGNILKSVEPAVSNNRVYTFGESIDPGFSPVTEARQKARRFAGGGSATSIGSGGDPFTILFKATMLVIVLQQHPMVVKFAPEISERSDLELVKNVVEMKLNPAFKVPFQTGDPLIERKSIGSYTYEQPFWSCEPVQIAQFVIALLKAM